MDRKNSRTGYRIGVDVGGTFTDAVACDTSDGSLRWAKVPSTPDEPAVGVLAAVSALTGDLAAVERFVHGISITTNAPLTPYGGLLNIPTGSVTQHELTGFMTGYEYNITVLDMTANCGGLVGRESEPLTITPQGMYDLNSDSSKQCLQSNIELVVWLARLHQPHSGSRHTDQACS